jgi:hypothetical protein
VEKALLRALEPVFRDLQSCGVPLPEVREVDWTTPAGADVPFMAYAMLWSQDGSGVRISLSLIDSEPDRVASAADQVQEWAIEDLWPDALTNWPPCPAHPNNHPLASATDDWVAVWVCPKDGSRVSPIGSL